MKYGKIVNGNLEIAPKTVTVGKTHYNPTPELYLSENGYLPIVEAESISVPTGYYARPTYTMSDGVIIESYIAEILDEVADAKVMLLDELNRSYEEGVNSI